MSAVLRPQGSSPTKAFGYQYDGMGNRLSEQQDEFTPNLASTVTSGVFNSVNQLTEQNPSGDVSVQFKGKVNEAATVTVGGQPAQVTPDQTSATGGRNFSATLNLSPGTQHTIAVTAEDFGAGNPPGTHHGGNVATKNYQLTVAAGTARSFSYDANGNCTANGNVTYEWDAEDRLVAINNGTLRSEFTYDAFGRRVMIVERDNQTVISTRKFLWLGAEIVVERDGNNQVKKRFYAEGFTHYQPSPVKYFYNRDHLGSIREVTDDVGNVLARYDYDPYGRRTLVSGTDLADFGYTGHYVHKPSGLHLALYRAYDADLGRWLNRDPIEEEGGINLYGYVGNDPINWSDEFGLSLTSPSVPPVNIPVLGNPDAKWVMGPKTGDRVRWVPDRPTPGHPNQELSWGKGYWKRTSNGTAQRFDHRGNPLSAKNAHEEPHRRTKSGPGSRCLGVAAGAVLAGAAGTASGMDSMVSSGAYQSMLEAAQQGELTDGVIFDASIDAAIETGSGSAFYGINGGWSLSQMWNDFKNWLFGD